MFFVCDLANRNLIKKNTNGNKEKYWKTKQCKYLKNTYGGGIGFLMETISSKSQ